MVLQGPLATLTDMPPVRHKGPMRWLVAGASGVVAAVFLAAVAQTSTTAAVTPSSTASVATVSSTAGSASTSTSASQVRLRTRAS
ncbi:MAG: hypothetical protein JO023_02490 [Chloroflexi bacterium]|nr:hypothetical protein [Chloroflexota bacterium]